MDPQTIISYSIAFLAASTPPLIAWAVWYSSRKSLQQDEVVRTLRARVETLEKERRELEARVEELEAKLRDTEAEWARKLREKDEECERRVRQLEEACEARVREASRLSSTARTLFEAFRAGVLEVAVKDMECEEVEIQPGKVLCCREGECRVVWPERSRPGEEVIVVKKRVASSQARGEQPRQSRRKREKRETELEPEPEEGLEPEEPGAEDEFYEG